MDDMCHGIAALTAAKEPVRATVVDVEPDGFFDPRRQRLGRLSVMRAFSCSCLVAAVGCGGPSVVVEPDSGRPAVATPGERFLATAQCSNGQQFNLTLRCTLEVEVRLRQPPQENQCDPTAQYCGENWGGSTDTCAANESCTWHFVCAP